MGPDPVIFFPCFGGRASMVKNTIMSIVSTGATCEGARGTARASSPGNSQTGSNMVWSMALGNTRIKVMAWMMEFAASCKSTISCEKMPARFWHLATSWVHKYVSDFNKQKLKYKLTQTLNHSSITNHEV
jgi:hypothetical protein